MPTAVVEQQTTAVTGKAAVVSPSTAASSPTVQEKAGVKTLKLGDYSAATEEKNDFAADHASFEVLKKWSDALVASDPDAVLALYAEEAALWPTLSNQIRYSKETMRGYFEMFVQKVHGAVSWKGCYVQELNEKTAVWSGLYGFPNGQGGETIARFTYVLVFIEDANAWKIMTHHSSLPPEN